MLINFISFIDIILTFRYHMLVKGKCKCKENWSSEMVNAFVNSFLPFFIFVTHVLSMFCIMQNQYSLDMDEVDLLKSETVEKFFPVEDICWNNFVITFLESFSLFLIFAFALS